MATTTQDKTISIAEAARILYRTPKPSDQQIFRVIEAMKSGALRARDYKLPLNKWTTTDRALADFMATNRAKGHNAQWGGDTRSPDGNYSGVVQSKDHEEVAEHLRGVYHGILRDYFLAVLWRRRISHRSAAFARAVTFGQAVICLLMIGFVLGSIRTFSGFYVPPERKAIEQWIDAETDDFAVTRWHPPESRPEGGLLVRVQYKYQRESPRWVHTDRTFVVEGDSVREEILE